MAQSDSKMASNEAFDLVRAAEALLEKAKQLEAVTKPGVDDNELELRRSIAQTAKKIAFETAPKIDVVKADWIVASHPLNLITNKKKRY